jgi:hypothetical protein
MRLLYVAFESSISPDGTVYLLSGTVLSSSHCPGISQRIFKYIHSLKTHFLHAGLSLQLLEADAEIEEWLPREMNALRSLEGNVEGEPLQLQRILATLREIQSQIRVTGFRKIQLPPDTQETQPQGKSLRSKMSCSINTLESPSLESAGWLPSP